MFKEQKVNKEKADGNVQAELAISMSCAPSKSCLFCFGYETDYLIEAPYILSEGFMQV